MFLHFNFLVPSLKDKIITKESINTDHIASLYDKVYSIDMRNISLFEKKKDDKISDKVCILIKDKSGIPLLYRLNCGYDECCLLDPYKYIY